MCFLTFYLRGCTISNIFGVQFNIAQHLCKAKFQCSRFCHKWIMSKNLDDWKSTIRLDAFNLEHLICTQVLIIFLINHFTVIIQYSYWRITLNSFERTNTKTRKTTYLDTETPLISWVNWIVILWKVKIVSYRERSSYMVPFDGLDSILLQKPRIKKHIMH